MNSINWRKVFSWEERPDSKAVAELVQALQSVWDQLGSDILDTYEQSDDPGDQRLVRNGLPGNIVWQSIADYVTSNLDADLLSLWESLSWEEHEQIAKLAFPPKQRYGR